MEILGLADRWGRPLVLSAERWDHILEEHRVMAGREDAIDAAVRNPDRVTRDVGNPERVCYYRAGLLDGAYRRFKVKVVAHLLPPDDTGLVRGYIVTAYPAPEVKRGEKLLWP